MLSRRLVLYLYSNQQCQYTDCVTLYLRVGELAHPVEYVVIT